MGLQGEVLAKSLGYDIPCAARDGKVCRVWPDPHLAAAPRPRSKDEEVYLNTSVMEARAAIERYFRLYNHEDLDESLCC